jgi:hypothetical protein
LIARSPPINTFCDLITPKKYIGRLTGDLAPFVHSQSTVHTIAESPPAGSRRAVAVRKGASVDLGTILISTTPIPEDPDA